jgi:hypothetical protein
MGKIICKETYLDWQIKENIDLAKLIFQNLKNKYHIKEKN